MAFDGLLITEIFHSIQGETSHSGLRYAFIRLTGCNLRCNYCDSAYAFKGGKKMTTAEVMAAIEPFQVKHVLLTGGEPLLQRNTPNLIEALRNDGYEVSVETHGEVSIETVASMARIVMDAKTPSSGMSREGFVKNLNLLKPADEIKFVIASQQDYEWAKSWIQKWQNNPIATQEIILSPAVPAINQPGDFDGITIRWLAEKMIEDRLPARIQTQLHKQIWGSNQKGV